MSLDDVGAASTLAFYGTTSAPSVTIPVPVGLFPTSLNATVDLPFRIRSAVLTVTQDGRLITQLGLPLEDLAPLVIPLDGVEIVNESVSLTLRLTSLAEDGFCLDLDHPIQFFDSSVTYAGTAFPPTTVADFLPPILRTLTIAVPATPSEAESAAAVQLAAALTARYRSQRPQVALVSLRDDTTTNGGARQPWERRIVIKEGPDDRVSLSDTDGFPDLVVSGPAEKLTNNTKLLTHGSVNLALSASVVPDDVPHSAERLPGNSTNLAALGQPNLTAVGMAPKVTIALDQTRFGHSTQGYRLHLTGRYTPVPADVGSQMTASVGEEIIGTWPTDADGVIDQWVDIPDRLVQRYTELVVGVETSGDTGSEYCGDRDFRPIRLSINGSTVVESAPANPPIPPGFQSLPQALMPRMQVGISVNSFADTARATLLAVGLQRLSGVPLAIDVTSLEKAIDSDDPAVLISADGWTDSSIPLPVSSEDGRLTLVGFNPGDEETTLTLDPGIQFGSLQTVFDGQRSLLIATSNGASGQLDELLNWLASEPQRFSGLRGNAVVAVAGRPPEMVPGRTPPSVYGPPMSSPEASGSSDGISPWWAAAGVGAAIVIGIVAFRMGARRSGPDGGQRVADEVGDDEAQS
ncbi:MAG: cellulose biosynthesis cyclic di-GMP-binding regulatory protein BcsB [Actinomycetia bacterium]|nr:cellulose biosynthesis cyclic di-GMP-binding regulatory protein BcsB [Actinomycetes bacterium]MCH9702286.1 cellulose biosynthesis cyclic di-GMP-binding regulatory protein BcsB [Actinomycetes bacterium]MCH9760504.1 cellulose biosynthesis cyclic di-GMP-binding regulatory protein BcsB [Actinomycetes bacterium]